MAMSIRPEILSAGPSTSFAAPTPPAAATHSRTAAVKGSTNGLWKARDVDLAQALAILSGPGHAATHTVQAGRNKTQHTVGGGRMSLDSL